jgi:hypothetical protein
MIMSDNRLGPREEAVELKKLLTQSLEEINMRSIFRLVAEFQLMAYFERYVQWKQWVGQTGKS